MYVKKENNKPVYVILKDNNPKKTNAYLILPPTPVTGIEKKDIVREAPVVDFWKYGWEEGEYYFKQPPDGFIGLAINSCAGRDQDQLHIHISCVKSGVRSALKNTTFSNDNWTKNPIKLENHDYYALTISSLDNSPFKILFDKSAASDHPGAQSLALIGAVATTNIPCSMTIARLGLRLKRKNCSTRIAPTSTPSKRASPIGDEIDG